MSAQNNDTLPKIWQISDIVHHIAMFSEAATTVALSRTCKLLYNSIITYDGLWHKLYQEHFPRDIETDIDWLDWQLRQEQHVVGAVTDAENEDASRLTWFQRYNQRVNMGSNWQKNKPTSMVHLKPFDIFRALKLRNIEQSIIANYPGWTALATRLDLRIDLIKLSLSDTPKIYPLDLDKRLFKTIENIAFYQYRQQAGGADDGIRIILHLECTKELINASTENRFNSLSSTRLHVLQIWNPNSCQLLQSMDFGDRWDGRIIDTSLLCSRSQTAGSTEILHCSFLKTQLCEPQLFNVPNVNYNDILKYIR
ncbi:hypothetical protein BDF19DRAFT_420837 [Syncephalis fuscata]|nr:hypothetical protein BDF19DRAFT_420837 [Syncephalis fuscata]